MKLTMLSSEFTQELIWDTDWEAEQKTATLRESDASKLLTLLRKAKAIDNDPAMAEDIKLIVTDILSRGFEKWTRSQLHSLLRLPQLERHDQIELVKTAVRGKISKVAAKPAHSQKKTPSGKTRVLHINYGTDGGGARNETNYQHVKFLCDRAAELGLQIHIFTTADGETDLKQDKAFNGTNVTWLRSTETPGKWTEDVVEFLVTGAVAVIESFDNTDLIEGRRQRGWDGLIENPAYREELFDPKMARDWVPEGLSNNNNSTIKDRLKAVEEAGGTVQYLRFYNEGGNVVTGENGNDRTIVLVGKDTIAATRAEYCFTDDDDVLRIIADDFGLDMSQIVPVEQPGTFHLDMGLLFLGKGVVLVNDSRADLQEAENAVTTAKNTAKLVAQLQLRSRLEDAAEGDLTKAGLKVTRAKLAAGAEYNFCNGEFVTGKDDKSYFLTNGTMNDEKQSEFKELLVNKFRVVTDVYFTPPSAAKLSLEEKGGIGCRAKGGPAQSAPAKDK